MDDASSCCISGLVFSSSSSLVVSIVAVAEASGVSDAVATSAVVAVLVSSFPPLMKEAKFTAIAVTAEDSDVVCDDDVATSVFAIAAATATDTANASHCH